jgi:hypothetical protein
MKIQPNRLYQQIRWISPLWMQRTMKKCQGRDTPDCQSAASTDRTRLPPTPTRSTPTRRPVSPVARHVIVTIERLLKQKILMTGRW